jgi:hypothetical protein
MATVAVATLLSSCSPGVNEATSWQSTIDMSLPKTLGSATLLCGYDVQPDSITHSPDNDLAYRVYRVGSVEAANLIAERNGFTLTETLTKTEIEQKQQDGTYSGFVKGEPVGDDATVEVWGTVPHWAGNSNAHSTVLIHSGATSKLLCVDYNSSPGPKSFLNEPGSVVMEFDTQSLED